MSGQTERTFFFNPAEENSEIEVLEAQPSKANSVVADKINESCEDLRCEIHVSETNDLKDDVMPHLEISENCPFIESGSGSKERSPNTISKEMCKMEQHSWISKKPSGYCYARAMTIPCHRLLEEAKFWERKRYGHSIYVHAQEVLCRAKFKFPIEITFLLIFCKLRLTLCSLFFNPRPLLLLR